MRNRIKNPSGSGTARYTAAPVRAVAFKILLSKVMASNLVGRVVSWWYGDVIPFHGCSIDLRGLSVPPRNKAALFWGFYESAEYRFVKTHLLRALPVIELGSSLGAISSVIARHIAPDQALICVEANPALISNLTRTLQLNAAGRRTCITNAAIAYGRPAVALDVSSDNLCSRLAADEAATFVSVPTTTLSEVVAQLGEDEYQLVADIEGAEATMLEVDAGVLDRCRLMIIELHPVRLNGIEITIDNLVNRLRNLGFDRLWRYGHVVACARSG